jgi:hypothetical protein
MRLLSIALPAFLRQRKAYIRGRGIFKNIPEADSKSVSIDRIGDIHA